MDNIEFWGTPTPPDSEAVNLELPDSKIDQTPQELVSASGSCTAPTTSFLDYTIHLRSWNTLLSWTVNSQVADLLTSWHKSLELRISGQEAPES